MRLLHHKTLEIVAHKMSDDEFANSTVSRKQVLSHCWSECLKYLATRDKPHPKMFIHCDYEFGAYINNVYNSGIYIGCNLKESHLVKYDEIWYGFLNEYEYDTYKSHFDDNYLFSDAVSLYLKGLNIFPYIFGEDYRKYIPIESLKEISRVVQKTLNKDKADITEIN